MHLNVRSLYNKLEEMKALFDNVDIMTISETWLNSNYDNDMINWPGNTVFRMDRIEKLGGVVACYVNNNAGLREARSVVYGE